MGFICFSVEIRMMFTMPLKVKFHKQKYMQAVTLCFRTTDEISYIPGCSSILDNTSYPKGYSPKHASNVFLKSQNSTEPSLK